MTFIIELKSKTPAVSRVECIASCAKPISTLGILNGLVKWHQVYFLLFGHYDLYNLDNRHLLVCISF